MNIVVVAGGQQWVVDDNRLLMFLQQNGQRVVTQSDRPDIKTDSTNAFKPDDLYLLKG